MPSFLAAYTPGDLVWVVPDANKPTETWVDVVKSVVFTDAGAVQYVIPGVEGRLVTEDCLEPATAEDVFRDQVARAHRERRIDLESYAQPGVNSRMNGAVRDPDLVVYSALLRRMLAGKVTDPRAMAEYILNPDKYSLDRVVDTFGDHAA